MGVTGGLRTDAVKLMSVGLFAAAVLSIPLVASAAPSPAPTVYGRGPEIHLLPNYGTIGTKMQIFGRGYGPGRRVGILLGGFGAEYLARPLMTVRVARDGTFHG